MIVCQVSLCLCIFNTGVQWQFALMGETLSKLYFFLFTWLLQSLENHGLDKPLRSPTHNMRDQQKRCTLEKSPGTSARSYSWGKYLPQFFHLLLCHSSYSPLIGPRGREVSCEIWRRRLRPHAFFPPQKGMPVTPTFGFSYRK